MKTKMSKQEKIMMESPILSVVIPVYNKQVSIKRTLERALHQTLRDFEVVIIDDGSTDQSAEIIKGFDDSRIRYYYQENGGVSKARNKGVDYARTNLIAFLDADDDWTPGHLDNLYKLYQKYPEAGLYANAYEMIDEGGKKLPVKYYVEHFPERDGIIKDYLLAVRGKQYPVWTSVSMVKREIFERTGRFMEGENHGEDQALWLKMSMLAPVAWSSYIGATYRKDYDGRLSARIVTRPDACMKTIDEMLIADTMDNVQKEKLMEFRNKLAIAHAAQCVLNGYRKEARDFLRQASKTTVFARRWRKWFFLSYWPVPVLNMLSAVKSLIK